MLFGLCNTPSTFQWLMNNILSDLLDSTIIMYLDNILVFSETPADHPHHIVAVLNQLCHNQLYCALDKCEFHVMVVEFLGYIVILHGVVIDPTKVQTMVEWPLPRSIWQIQVFLGFANFYCRFISHYSHLVAPLMDMLKGAPSGWVEITPAALAAFHALKKAFTEVPILKHFYPKLDTVLSTNTSNMVVALVLLQWHPMPGTPMGSPPSLRTHMVHPAMYWSHKMIPAEQNYEIHDKELLAIVGACTQWRHYLHRITSLFGIYTDHQALQYFSTK